MNPPSSFTWEQGSSNEARIAYLVDMRIGTNAKLKGDIYAYRLEDKIVLGNEQARFSPSELMGINIPEEIRSAVNNANERIAQSTSVQPRQSLPSTPQPPSTTSPMVSEMPDDAKSKLKSELEKIPEGKITRLTNGYSVIKLDKKIFVLTISQDVSAVRTIKRRFLGQNTVSLMVRPFFGSEMGNPLFTLDDPENKISIIYIDGILYTAPYTPGGENTANFTKNADPKIKYLEKLKILIINNEYLDIPFRSLTVSDKEHQIINVVEELNSTRGFSPRQAVAEAVSPLLSSGSSVDDMVADLLIMSGDDKIQLTGEIFAYRINGKIVFGNKQGPFESSELELIHISDEARSIVNSANNKIEQLIAKYQNDSRISPEAKQELLSSLGNITEGIVTTLNNGYKLIKLDGKVYVLRKDTIKTTENKILKKANFWSTKLEIQEVDSEAFDVTPLFGDGMNNRAVYFDDKVNEIVIIYLNKTVYTLTYKERGKSNYRFTQYKGEDISATHKEGNLEMIIGQENFNIPFRDPNISSVLENQFLNVVEEFNNSKGTTDQKQPAAPAQIIPVSLAPVSPVPIAGTSSTPILATPTAVPAAGVSGSTLVPPTVVGTPTPPTPPAPTVDATSSIPSVQDAVPQDIIEMNFQTLDGIDEGGYRRYDGNDKKKIYLYKINKRVLLDLGDNGQDIPSNAGSLKVRYVSLFPDSSNQRFFRIAFSKMVNGKNTAFVMIYANGTFFLYDNLTNKYTKLSPPSSGISTLNYKNNELEVKFDDSQDTTLHKFSKLDPEILTKFSTTYNLITPQLQEYNELHKAEIEAAESALLTAIPSAEAIGRPVGLDIPLEPASASSIVDQSLQQSAVPSVLVGVPSTQTSVGGSTMPVTSNFPGGSAGSSSTTNVSEAEAVQSLAVQALESPAASSPAMDEELDEINRFNYAHAMMSTYDDALAIWRAHVAEEMRPDTPAIKYLMPLSTPFKFTFNGLNSAPRLYLTPEVPNQAEIVARNIIAKNPYFKFQSIEGPSIGYQKENNVYNLNGNYYFTRGVAFPFSESSPIAKKSHMPTSPLYNMKGEFVGYQLYVNDNQTLLYFEDTNELYVKNGQNNIIKITDSILLSNSTSEVSYSIKFTENKLRIEKSTVENGSPVIESEDLAFYDHDVPKIFDVLPTTFLEFLKNVNQIVSGSLSDEQIVHIKQSLRNAQWYEVSTGKYLVYKIEDKLLIEDKDAGLKARNILNIQPDISPICYLLKTSGNETAYRFHFEAMNVNLIYFRNKLYIKFRGRTFYVPFEDEQTISIMDRDTLFKTDNYTLRFNTSDLQGLTIELIDHNGEVAYKFQMNRRESNIPQKLASEIFALQDPEERIPKPIALPAVGPVSVPAQPSIQPTMDTTPTPTVTTTVKPGDKQPDAVAPVVAPTSATEPAVLDVVQLPPIAAPPPAPSVASVQPIVEQPAAAAAVAPVMKTGPEVPIMSEPSKEVVEETRKLLDSEDREFLSPAAGNNIYSIDLEVNENLNIVGVTNVKGKYYYEIGSIISSKENQLVGCNIVFNHNSNKVNFRVLKKDDGYIIEHRKKDYSYEALALTDSKYTITVDNILYNLEVKDDKLTIYSEDKKIAEIDISENAFIVEPEN